MKKIWVVSLFLTMFTFFAYAQEIIGEWTVESFGVKGSSTWIIKSDNTIIATIHGEEEQVKYSYDNKSKIFILILPNMQIETKIEFRNDSIYFYITSLENSPLYPQIEQLYKSLQGINSLNDELAESIYETWKKELTKIPFMKAYKRK